MRFSLLLALLPACAGSQPGEPLTVAGTVVSVDLSPMQVDGDALVMIEADGGEAVTVRVPARRGLCVAGGLDQTETLREGDRIEVRGTRSQEGGVRPCTEPDHYLRRVSPDVSRYVGIYEFAFEASSGRPCGEPERWWLVSDSGFTAQYEALRSSEAESGEPFWVRVEVDGCARDANASASTTASSPSATSPRWRPS